MVEITDFWCAKLATPEASTSQLRGRKRRGNHSDEGPDDEETEESLGPKSKGRSPPKKRAKMVVTKGQGTTSKGKGKAKERTKPQLLDSYPTPSRTIPLHDVADKSKFYYDDPAKIAAWIRAVASVGPLEKVDTTVIWPIQEAVREPFRGDWHNWSLPWTQPSHRSKFSSNDWAMQESLCLLTMKPKYRTLSDSEGFVYQ